MKCIKISAADGTIIGVEKIENPAYVFLQQQNGIIIRCSSVKAQGIISADSSKIYQLKGKTALPGDFKTAEFIGVTEADSLLASLEIPEEAPETEVPEAEQPTEQILTAEQMRVKIIEQAERIEMLESCVLEMSEIVYA